MEYEDNNRAGGQPREELARSALFLHRDKLFYALFAVLAAAGLLWQKQGAVFWAALLFGGVGILAGGMAVGRGYFGPADQDETLYDRWRVLPAALALLAAILSVVFYILEEKAGGMTMTAAMACLASCLPPALGKLSHPARRQGLLLLARQGLILSKEEKLAKAASASLILADQGLFYGKRSAELKSFYFAGKRHRMSSLHFKDHLPLVIGMRFADDGSLGRACGLKENMSDTLLRTMRTSAEERRLLGGFRLRARREFSEKLGFAAAEYVEEGGRALSCAAGRPEALLPLCVTICTEWGSARPITLQDERRLRVLLRQATENGQQTIALAAGIPEKREMTLVGLVFAEASPEGEASAAVAELEAAGVSTMLVSSDLEGSALYKAGAAGFPADISRVTNGTRLERMAREGGGRNLRTLRLAAEMQPVHRVLLSELASAGQGVIAASKSAEDGILALADVRVCEEKEGLYPPDVYTKSCRMPLLSALIRLARSAERAARKISLWQLAIQLGMAVSLLFLSAMSQSAPLSPAAVLLLVLVAPVPGAWAMAFYGRGPVKAKGPGLSILQDRPRIGRLPGRPLTAGAVIGGLFAGGSGVLLFDSLAGKEATAASAGLGLWISLLFSFLALAMVLQVWGETLFSEASYGSRVFLIVLLASAVVLVGFLLIPGVPGFMGLAPLPVRQFPKTLLPAALLLGIYELGRLLLARLQRK